MQAKLSVSHGRPSRPHDRVRGVSLDLQTISAETFVTAGFMPKSIASEPSGSEAILFGMILQCETLPPSFPGQGASSGCGAHQRGGRGRILSLMIFF